MYYKRMTDAVSPYASAAMCGMWKRDECEEENMVEMWNEKSGSTKYAKVWQEW